jgi:hypothetical protein
MAKAKTPEPVDIVAEACQFLSDREGAESECREDFVEDLEFAFVPGAQWQTTAKTARRGRPCFEFNRVAGAIHALVGDMRKTEPGVTVRAVNKQAAVGTANTFAGLIRDIHAQSAAPVIFSESFKYSVAGGFGAWRVVPEYADDESFDQVLRLKRIPNALTVYFDENADPFGRGGMRCMVAERISRTKYEALYGDEPSDVPVMRDGQGWFTKDEVRVAEFYKMIPKTRVLAQLSDGRTMDCGDGGDYPSLKALEDDLKLLSDAPTVERKRDVTAWVCEWTKVDGKRILDGPTEYKYRNIPVVRLPGRFVIIEGKHYYQSLIRHAKDAARTYNYNRSNMVETVALTPRAPYIGTAKMFKGHEDQWSRANVSNAPYLTYDVDPDAPQAKPERAIGPEVPQGYIALAAHDAEDIRQTTGYFNPALDQQTAAGDAESGRALRTRLTSADSGSYEFLDNYAKAVQYTGEILVDMIPVHYDTERVVRILGADGRESFEDLSPEALRQGKYDVTVTLGPAYATARMEALDTLLEAAGRMPIIYEEAPDVIVRNLDVRGADEIERRVRARLAREGKIQLTEEEAAGLPPPPPPDPVQTALAARLDAQRARDAASAAKTNIEAASSMAAADTAQRREQLELAEMVADLTLKKVETMLAQKALIAPVEAKVTV